MALHKLFAAVLCVASVAAEDITVTLPDGTQLLGTLTGNIASFKGVPFAQPPVGNLRWAPPAPWVNRDPAVVVDATQFGSPCKQVRGGTELGLENCLFLNVYVDLNKTGGTGDQRTPVGLYIHGGSYVNGAGSDYDGTDFVNFWNGSLIVVTTNYRLNVFGFCGSEQLRAQDPLDGSAGNYGERLLMYAANA